LDDVDDEVRDRAAFNLKLMGDEPLANSFIRDGALACRLLRAPKLIPSVSSPLESTFSLDALEAKLTAYIADSDALSAPFDFNAVPKVSKEQSLENALRTSRPSFLRGALD
jgi:coatomer protein complex subunit gamma